MINHVPTPGMGDIRANPASIRENRDTDSIREPLVNPARTRLPALFNPTAALSR